VVVLAPTKELVEQVGLRRSSAQQQQQQQQHRCSNEAVVVMIRCVAVVI
jgi:hypothetical protein